MPRIDDVDRKIINTLQKNARIPLTEIAQKLEVSEGTIRKRLQRLENEGVIRGYSADIDPAKLGYRTVTLLGLDTDPESFLDAIECLRKLPQIRWVAKSTGDHMIMAEIWTRDDDELSQLIERHICTIPGVKRVCPAIILEKVK